MKAGPVQLLGGASIVALALSTFSTNASAAAVCYDPWSKGGNTETIGPVCGDIKLQGGGERGRRSKSIAARVRRDPSPAAAKLARAR
jgi:hypothetical protein